MKSDRILSWRAFVPAGRTWKAPKWNGFPFTLVFNEKLCETTILKFINDGEYMLFTANINFCGREKTHDEILYVLITIDDVCSQLQKIFFVKIVP